MAISDREGLCPEMAFEQRPENNEETNLEIREPMKESLNSLRGIQCGMFRKHLETQQGK